MNTKYSAKILIILLVVLVLGTGAFLGLHTFKKYTESQGLLKVRMYPPEAALQIGNRTYQNKQGILNIRLKPGQYSLFFSCPDYSFWEDKITVESKKTTDLGNVYLFPNNWQKEKTIAEETISRFYLSPDSNRILYLEKSSKYIWYLFDRNSKKKEYLLETSSLPHNVVFSSKKILIHTGTNNWQIIFLPKSLVESSISLNNSFKEALEKNNLKQKDTSLDIGQAVFYPENDGDIIIKTSDAVYLLNFLTDSLKKIYEGKSSPFIVDNDHIYFIKENGVLAKFSLLTKEEIQTSLYSFSLDDLEKTKIRKGKNDGEFLIVEGTQKAYYLKNFQGLPSLIGENIIDGVFSFEKKEILLSSKDKVEIYDAESGIKSSKKLYSDVPVVWFLNNEHLLFLKDNLLNIYTLKNNKIWPIASDVKNNNFVYDPSINYIFYLSDKGILRIGI